MTGKTGATFHYTRDHIDNQSTRQTTDRQTDIHIPGVFSGFQEKNQSYRPLCSARHNINPMTLMTLQEQAWQSGLVLSDNMDHNSDVSQWNLNDWPPLLGGYRFNHASVVLDHPEKDGSAQTVVVLGGDILCGFDTTISVLLLSLAEENKQWREGPPLSDKRGLHAAVVCNGGVYVIGGHNESSRLDSIERIDVEKLLQTYSTSTTGNHWTILNCRLSTPKTACSAVAVQNRYTVIMGGGHEETSLSSVDIVDTASTKQPPCHGGTVHDNTSGTVRKCCHW